MTYSASIPVLMLVDDAVVDQKMYARIVRRSGIVGDMLQFHFAHEALDYLVAKKDPQPDLILLDINMPRMSGFEFLEALAGAVGSDHAPVVVMLTTSLDPQDRVRAAQYHAVKDFINKPLTTDDLLRLTSLLRDIRPAA